MLAVHPRVSVIDARTDAEVLHALAERSCDVVVSGLGPSSAPDLAVLDVVAQSPAPRPVVILTGRGDEQWAVQAMRRGAADYISTKDDSLDSARLVGLLESAIQNWESAQAKSAQDRRYARLYEQATGLLCVVDFLGFAKLSNPVWDAILGYTREEIMATSFVLLVHPDDVSRMIEVGVRLRAGETVTGIEVRIRMKNGAYKPLIWNAVPCVEEQVFFATAHDLSQRKAIEDELRESRQRLELIASATKEAMWDWDASTGRIWKNAEFAETFGGPDHADEDPASWWCERVHPDDRARVRAYRPSLAADGRQHWALEYRMRRVDGSYAHVYDRAFVLFGPDGKQTRMVASVMDVSALKSAEQKVRESEERLRLAAKATREMIWDWDFRTGHVWRGEGMQTLFGYSPEMVEPSVEWWLERIHPDDLEHVLAKSVLRCGPNRHQNNSEYRFRRADGSYADIYDRGFVMYDADGAAVRMVGSLMDVSLRRRAEEVAHMQQSELAHISRLRTMGEIATGVAHELNQPLTAIANYAESCKQAITAKAAGNEAKLLKWIDQIGHNTQRAGEMLRRLRRFARKSEPRRADADVNDLVQEVIDLLAAETRPRRIRVRWQPIEALSATVDRVQVQQVLVNLLRNAFDAVAPNAPDDRQVVVAARVAGRNIEFLVQDCGPGLDAEARDRAFEAFFTTKPNGVGVGLAISRSIVEDHGGRMWVDEPNGRGAVFRFTLPLEGVGHGGVINGCDS
jgi:PAS domain S-box-containing protein